MRLFLAAKQFFCFITKVKIGVFLTKEFDRTSLNRIRFTVSNRANQTTYTQSSTQDQIRSKVSSPEITGCFAASATVIFGEEAMRKRLASLKYFADILIDFGFSTGFEPAMISMARTSPRKLSSSCSVSFWSAEKFKSVGSISPHLMFLKMGVSDTGETETGSTGVRADVRALGILMRVSVQTAKNLY